MRKYRFVILTVVLLMMTTLGTGITVRGMEKEKLNTEIRYYHEMEKQYVKETRTYLNELGYENAGVSMTMVTDQDGTREYTVSIHHMSIDKLDIEAKQRLEHNLQSIKFRDENCQVLHKFL